MSLHEEKKDALASIKSMREWVVEGEQIFDGSWAKQPEEITNAEVGRRFDAYLERLSCFLAAEERTEDEKLRRGSSSEGVDAFATWARSLLRSCQLSSHQ